jgi:distribution and morphology protein 31
MYSDDAPDKREAPDTRPQKTRDSEEPEPERGQSQSCTCGNTLEGKQKPFRHTTPSLGSQSQRQQQPHQPIDPANPPKHLEDYSRFFRRLALSLPHPHRPTRDDFLKVATGFWQRLKIRFKWFTIKSFRKFNADDISAFVTWFLMSQTLWILIGT